MGEEELYNNDLNVDTRSDTTYKGYNPARTPYGASYLVGTNPFTDILNAVSDKVESYDVKPFNNNPYLITGTAPAVGMEKPFVILRTARTIPRGFIKGNEVTPSYRYPISEEGLTLRTARPTRLTNPITNEAELAAAKDYVRENTVQQPKKAIKRLQYRSAKNTQKEYYQDRVNYNKKTRTQEKNAITYETGSATHTNSGQRAIRNRQIDTVRENITKYPKFEQRNLDKLKLRLAKKGYTREQIEKNSEVIQFYKTLAEKYGYFKTGGKLLKKGNKIHIKKKNRGKFTSYCGGTVTNKCIRKAKASGNSTLIKRATFAQNARKWKHKDGGVIVHTKLLK